MAVGLKVRELEKYQKLSRLSDAKLARQMGMSRTQVWRVKKGKCEPGEDFVAGCLRVFEGAGVTFEDLFFVAPVLRDGNATENDAAEERDADDGHRTERPA